MGTCMAEWSMDPCTGRERWDGCEQGSTNWGRSIGLFQCGLLLRVRQLLSQVSLLLTLMIVHASLKSSRITKINLAKVKYRHHASSPSLTNELGLALLFFLLSLMGNATYGAGILCHSVEKEYLVTNLPWLIGSLGTMVEDAIIFVQFRMYPPKPSTPSTSAVE
jgi:hypothetical protein